MCIDCIVKDSAVFLDLSTNSGVMQEERMKDAQLHLLSIRREKAKEMCQVMKTLAFRETATFIFNSTTLKIYTNDEHNSQAELYLESEAFSLFTVRDEMVPFTLKIGALLECLSILDGPSSQFELTYDGMGEPLRVMVEEEGVVLSANIPTLATHLSTLEFDTDDIKARILMQPSLLKDTIKDLDTSTPSVTVRVTPKKLVFVTKGNMGKVKTVFPRNSDEIEKFECDSIVSFTYKSTIIKRMNATLAMANKAVLQIDATGVLWIQFQLNLSENDQPFVDFKCVANSIDEEDQN